MKSAPSWPARLDDPPVALWAARKAGRELRCDLVRHPLGYELRVWVGDGELLRSEVVKNVQRIQTRQAEWRKAAEAKGWKFPTKHRSS